jgi:hypothetical protein
MARIDYAVHGHGRGHASRARAVITRLLAEGHTVEVFAGGDGVSLLSDLCEVRPRRPLLPGPRVGAALLLRAHADAARLRSERPALVVTDGDQAIVLGARRAHVPCLAIGHDLVFSACALPPGLPTLSLARERLNSLVPTRLADARIAVHFLPIEPRLPHTRVARALAPVELRELDDVGDLPSAPFLVAYLSDGDRESVLARLAEADVDVVAFGDGLRARGRVRTLPVSRERFVAHLRRAMGVVATAGSNVLAECVLTQKPVFALHSGRHHEQALNAALVERARVGEALRIADLTAERVRAFVAHVHAGGFAQVELAHALPALDDVALETVKALLRRG